ncbi:MAG TPA: cytochrome c oxidase assembly protein [Conexibacter sp.]|jgi:cytochrome c oxidase assembly factor CtaG
MPSALDLLVHWQLDPAVLVSALAVVGLYGWGVVRVERSHPSWRSLCFALGVLAVLTALLSGLDGWAERLLSVHMAQHLVLVFVAAPLLVAGAPVSLALRALPRDDARALARALRSRPVRVLVNPAIAWTLFGAVTLATHLTGFYELALQHPLIHALEHLLYLGSAILFWLPALGGEPLPYRLGFVARMVYVLGAMPAMAFVGIALVLESSLRYPSYAAPARALGIDALANQHAAGMLMWSGSGLLAAALTIIAAWSALMREERRQLAREARLGGAP